MSRSRIPSLDGIRAISILTVIGYHILQSIGLDHSVGLLWFTILNGNTGVYVFFVLSGYLITTLLMKEHELNNSINLRHFYVRRAFRILPVVLANLFVIWLLFRIESIHVSLSDFAGAAFFYRNYFRQHGWWPVDHYWTLSMEEQFYFVWPVVMAYALRRWGLRGARRAALSVVIASPFVRVISYYAGSSYLRDVVNRSFHSRADALMWGAFGALSVGTKPFEKCYSQMARAPWLPLLVGIYGESYFELRFGNIWTLPFGYTLAGAGILFCLLWAVRNPKSLIGLFLNSSVLTRIGVLSYSIYIWQQLFLNEHNRELLSHPSKGLTRLAAGFVATVLFAELSYKFVERGALNLRVYLEER